MTLSYHYIPANHNDAMGDNAQGDREYSYHEPLSPIGDIPFYPSSSSPSLRISLSYSLTCVELNPKARCSVVTVPIMMAVPAEQQA